MYDFLTKINFFDEKESLSLVDQLLATTIFVSLITIALFIIVVFTGFTIQSPSENTFKQLFFEYPSTLLCPECNNEFNKKRIIFYV
jgi:uncharacterized membrane protein